MRGHIELHVDQAKACSWSAEEVIERWHRLFAGVYLSYGFLRDESMSDAPRNPLDDIVETWRERLGLPRPYEALRERT